VLKRLAQARSDRLTIPLLAPPGSGPPGISDQSSSAMPVASLVVDPGGDSRTWGRDTWGIHTGRGRRHHHESEDDRYGHWKHRWGPPKSP
jgi:hypothetical protein